MFNHVFSAILVIVWVAIIKQFAQVMIWSLGQDIKNTTGLLNGYPLIYIFLKFPFQLSNII